MHARTRRRKVQPPLRLLRDIHSRKVFAPLRPRLARWERKSPKEPRGTRGIVDISEACFLLCIISTLLVLMFFFNCRILPTRILQTGPNSKQHHGPVCRQKLQTGPHFSTTWIPPTGFLQTVSIPK